MKLRVLCNRKNSTVFLIDCFLYTVSYKPILSVIFLIKHTYQHERIFLFLEPNESKSPYLYVQELYCSYFATFNVCLTYKFFIFKVLSSTRQLRCKRVCYSSQRLFFSLFKGWDVRFFLHWTKQKNPKKFFKKLQKPF